MYKCVQSVNCQTNKQTMADREELKVAVIGAGAVGKSSLTIYMTAQKKPTGEYDPTIEDAYFLHTKVDEKPVYLEILDTAGQDEYRALRPQYMRNCFGFLMVCDLTSKHSLENLVEFIEEIRRTKDIGDDEKIPIVLCGNKHDLCESDAQKRAVTVEGSAALTSLHGFSVHYLNNCPVFETSAKSGKNVQEAFFQLIRECRKVKEKTPAAKPKKKGIFESSGTSDIDEDLKVFSGNKL
jgi:GTPase KRas protein